MKKIAIRKMNRTLLKKEGTKEIYITGKSVLMPFFGYTSIEELATSRKEQRAEKIFHDKKGYLYGSNTKEISLRVTKENNEVRLTGFEKYFEENGIYEVDKIVLEYIEEQNGGKHYFLDYIKCNNTRVLQKYDKKDDLNNYEVSKNDKGFVQFVEKNNWGTDYKNVYWLWDDSFDERRWNNILGIPIEVFFDSKGVNYQKVIRITKSKREFNKLLKAISSSRNRVETQKKQLYFIEELVNGEWMATDFDNIRNLEIIDEKTHIRITDRNVEAFTYYEGGIS